MNKVFAVSVAVMCVFSGSTYAQDTPAPAPVPTLAEALQSVIDAQAEHDRGAVAMQAAALEASQQEAEAAAARQHVLDVQADRDATSATIVERAQAAVERLNAIIAEHSGGGQ